MKTKLKKIFLSVFIALIAFSLNVNVLYAFGGLSINPVSMTNKVMKDLGVDKAELKNTIKTANVSRQKKNQPQVMLVFTPTNPAPGDELNVTAMPNFFLNTTNNLYFTWYLKNARCYDEMIDGEDYKDKFLPGDFEKCDLNHDEEVDVEDYKIKAMRIIASDDFNWDPDGNGRADTNVYDPPSYIDDQDSYDASSGGEDQKNKEAHCFIHDVKSGDEYELADCINAKPDDDSICECGHLFPNAIDDDIIINGLKGIDESTAANDFKFGKREEGFWRTNPNSRDTSQAGQFDEATVAGLGRATFKFNYSAGDKIGVAIEGVSIEPTQEKDSSYKTMWAFSKNTCDELLDADGFGENDGGYSPTVTTTTTTQSQIGDPLAIPPIPDLTCTIVVKKTTYPFIIAGTQINDSGDVRTHVITETTVTCTDDSTGLPATPRSPLQAYTILRESSCPDDENVTILDYEYENDSSDSTADTTYTCNAFDLTNQDIPRTNLTVKKLNACLYENLLTPAEGGGSKEKMEVTIAYSPKNPTNDSSGLKNGSELSLSSFINNAQNLEYLNYEWQVSYASTSDSDTWTLLTKDELPEATQTVGLGVDTFSFKLNFETSASMPSIPKYLKVKLIVKDNLTGGDEREGRTDVIIPIYSTEKRIMVYPTVINDTPLSVDIDDSSSTKELCVQDIGGIITPDAVCNVSRNTLLGVKIDGPSDYDNFKWSLAGANLFCPNATDFKDCINADQTQTNINYFPVLKSIGDEFIVNLIAVKKDTGEKLNLTRTFRIVTPSVEIIPKEFNNPADPAQYTCRAKLTESSTDPITGNPVEVRSKTDFNALTGFEIVLTPKGSGVDLTNPDNRKEYKWVINGDVITEENVVEYGYGITDGVLTLPAKDYGEAYQIDFSALYSQDIKVNKVLNKYWKVGYDDLYEKRLTHAIKITMADSALVKAKTNSQKILATISAGIPSYIVFLFRIVLSGFVILFLLKILTFLIPKTKTYHYDEF